jgi:hypothetical protein
MRLESAPPSITFCSASAVFRPGSSIRRPLNRLSDVSAGGGMQTSSRNMRNHLARRKTDIAANGDEYASTG